ncbi:MAG TPA: malectin domain-containing carbohydrate-binding protein [Pricia sp.]|nr:malectin domain-containing carbohydrate-binding protein [Pricia sp.]
MAVRLWGVPVFLLATSIFLMDLTDLSAQGFSQNHLNFNGNGSVSAGTSLMFGPDGRLYVAEYTGAIKVFRIQRNGPGNYILLDQEVLTGLQDIQDHNDDGDIFTSTFRETTGLTVAGTAAHPVIYVCSSDFRIGGGSGGGRGDTGLDTNSGIITRFTWTGSSWNVVDLVRGLPRSEENHANNGLEFVTVNGTDYLIVAQGGHTNAGSPSANFAYTGEYALSAAILSINLSLLNGMPIKNDNGRSYIYDLPTLDDPTRTNANGIHDPDAPGYDGVDLKDPFGGNDGLNQAVITPDGPVQIFSPGFRNAYDLVVTQNGAVYVTDNGANGGWGGFPANEGIGSATNDYVSGEPGSTSPSGGEQINNKDHLTLITQNIQSYTFGSFYGGHPNPVRANPNGAGLYTNPAVSGRTGALFRTLKYDPNGSRQNSVSDPNIALPANWPPVQAANPQESDWRGPGIANPDGTADALVTTWNTNTNGIDEYTATNFNNAMKGNLIAGVNTGVLRRVQLKPDGSLQTLTPAFAQGLGGDALGVTCNGDTDPFPGTIWVVTLNGKLIVLEPQDFADCPEPGQPGYDANADDDQDGYTNQDEQDNGTNPCNGASQPNDLDKSAGGSLISDLNDNDDDNDGIADANDPFQLGDPDTAESDAFPLPLTNELFSSNPTLKGYLGLGMTGMMNNGTPNPNWLDWLDRRDSPSDPNPNDILGGAIGAMTMQMTHGTALGSTNTQEKGFQYGVLVDRNTGVFTVSAGLTNFNAPLQLYGNSAAPNGELGLFIGDGTQANYIKFILTKAGLTVRQEINNVPQAPIHLPIAVGNRPNSGVSLYLVVDPSNGNIALEYAFDGGARAALGNLTAQGAILNALQQSSVPLAVGLIGTSNAAGVEVEGTWDFLNVIPNTDGFAVRINSGGPQITQDGKVFSADQFFTGGKIYTNNKAQVPPMYRTERSALPPTFSYDIPIPNGSYTVILHFAEIYWGAVGGGPGGTGKRIFDVTLEGSLILDNYDINAETGPQTVVTKSFDTMVGDGVLALNFSALPGVGGVDQPKLSAIEILGNTGGNVPIQVGLIADQTSTLGEQLIGNLGVSASGGDGNLHYSAVGLPPGVILEPTNGQLGGTIASNASVDQPYQVIITVDDSDGMGTDAKTVNFSWTILNASEWVDKNESENYTARHECSFVQAGNKFYLMGGRENSRTVDIYNYTTDSWTSLVNSAPLAFNHFQATEYQGLIWVIGAFKDNGFPNEVPADHVWAFDPVAQEWIQGPAIPSGRKRGSAGLVVHNGKFYIVGGNTKGHNGGFVPWFDVYDPATGIWTPLSNAPRARDHFHAGVVGNKMYLAGGRLSGGTGGTFKPLIPQVDVYDFTTGTWSTLPSGQNLPTPRGAPSVANFNGKLMVIGGEVQNENVYGTITSDALKITEAYDPVTGIWTRMGDLNHERHGTQAIVSGGGVFLLAGSPNLGGGNQRNMEYLGADSPMGAASTASTLSSPGPAQVQKGLTKDIVLTNSGGNIGTIVRSIHLSGAHANEFSLVSGALSNVLLKPNSSHTISVTFTGTLAGRTATLTIAYGASGQITIPLQSTLGPAQSGITGFVLVNADMDTDIFELTDGMPINAATVNGKRLSIRANTNPSTVGSVSFSISGLVNRTITENVVPYALFGDINGNYSGVQLPLGNYTLNATAYTGPGKSGTILGTKQIQFSIGAASTAKGFIVSTDLGNGPATGEVNPDVRVFPNPAVSEVYFVPSDPSVIILGAYLYDSGGRMIREYSTAEMGKRDGQYMLNVSDLGKGIYFVRLRTDSPGILRNRAIVKK